MPETLTTQETEELIPLERVVLFLKHHLHDVRNELNALNLEATLLGVYLQEGEVSDTVRRIQELLHQSAGRLGGLSRKLSEPAPSAEAVPARFILSLWREDWASSGRGFAIEWKDSVVDDQIAVDAMHMAEIFKEWLANSKRYGSTGAEVALLPAGDEVIFRLTEHKEEPVDPSHWGRAPFEQARKGNYGLGLWRVRKLAEANHAQWRQYTLPDQPVLISEMKVPVFHETA